MSSGEALLSGRAGTTLPAGRTSEDQRYCTTVPDAVDADAFNVNAVPTCPVAGALITATGGSTIFAVTVLAAFMVTTQVPVPEQPLPLQPAKMPAPLASVLSVTVVPRANPALQVLPQEIPAGLDTTIPGPPPTF